MRTKALAVATIALLGFGSVAHAASGDIVQVTLTVNVGSGASIGMGPGGMGGSLTTGGGPVMSDNQQVGTFMHTTQMATMQGMMGGQTLQQRIMSFEFSGFCTLFTMMAGGSTTTWAGGKGFVMGGTDACEGLSGSFTVGDPVGPNLYPFNFAFRLP